MRIGARFALIGDGLGRSCVPFGASISRARRKSSGVSTPSGATSTSATSMRMPASERPQLFEPFAPLERRGRQGDEARERGAAIGVEADMVQQRPLAPRRASAGEIERAQPAGRDFASPTTLTTLGSSRSSARRISGRQRRDVDARVGERRRPRRAPPARDRRQIALDVDDRRRGRRPDRRAVSASKMRSEPEP